MTIQEACDILEVVPHSSPKQIRDAYFALVEVWHPDRFGNKPELRERATEKLKDLNLAYELLCPRGKDWEVPAKQDQSRSGATVAAGSDNPHVLVRCVSCLHLNRVVCFGPGLVCGNCGASLSLKGKHSGFRPDGRIPCGDDACLGVIGLDGYCTVCGLTLQQSSQLFGQPAGRAKSRMPARMGITLLIAFLLVVGLVSGISSMKGASVLDSKAAPMANQADPGPAVQANLPGPLTAPASPLEIDDLLRTAFFESGGQKKEKIKAYQLNLRTLGYYTGRIDGKYGPDTYSGLRDFMLDFNLPRFKLTADDLLRTLNVQVRVQDVHHDWTSLHQNGKFELWVNSLEPQKRLAAREIIFSDHAEDIIALVKSLKKNNRLASMPWPQPSARN